MDLKALVNDQCHGSLGLRMLGEAALTALGREAEVLEGMTEVRIKGQKVEFWRMLLLSTGKLFDFTLTPTDNDRRAELKIKTCPLRHIAAVDFTGQIVLSGFANLTDAVYSVRFLPGLGLDDFQLPPMQDDVKIHPDDAAGYRRIGAHLFQMLA